MSKHRTSIRNLLERIIPVDVREKADIKDILDWIDTGAELYRRQKPDVPNKHLVSYFVLVDRSRQSLLLIDHRKAGLWLPTGGHVDPEEDPHRTVLRELEEELGSRALMVSEVAALPLFVTATLTNGADSHTDVSFWYVVSGDVNMWLDPDPREFAGHKWLTFDEVLAMDIEELDPHMHRFIAKLKENLSSDLI